MLTLDKYASKLGDGVTFPEAKERCQKHAPFLLAHFAKDPFVRNSSGDQLCRWSATLFYTWLTTENEDLCKKLADAASKRAAEPGPAERQPSFQSDTTDAKSEPQDDAQLLLRTPAAEPNRATRSGERATRLSQDADVEMKDVPAAEEPQRIETPVQPPVPVSMRSALVPAPSMPTASIPSTPALQKADEPPAPPSDPLHAFLELLEEILVEVGGDSRKITPGTVQAKMYFKCSTKYGACKEVSHYYAKQLAASLPSKWYPSPYFAWLKEKRDEPWWPEVVTADTVALQLKRRKKMDRGKTKFGGPDNNPTPASGYMGKRLPATPRTGGLTVKRTKPDSYDDGDDEDGRPFKHTKTAYDLDSNEDDSEDEGVSDSSDDAPAKTYLYSTTPIPIPKAPKETVPVVVRAEKIPTLSPAGPNGTWRCEEDGCGHIIRAAEEPMGKRLIEEHFQDHAKRVEKINLALAEGTKGHLPIK